MFRSRCSCALTLLTACAALLLTACQNQTPPGPPAGGPPAGQVPGGPPQAAGKAAGAQVAGAPAAFNANCTRCHLINGQGKPGGKDLSKAGSDPDLTLDYLFAFIKNPKSKKPKCRMPAFEGKLSDDEIKTIAEYLTTLK